MNLLFKNDRKPSGKLIKAYLNNWNWKKDNGCYSSGKGFLTIHWEVRYETKNMVRLHVEAPSLKTNIELNSLKSRIIISILAKTFTLPSILEEDIELGKRLNYVDKFKSSEVLKVIFPKKNTNIKENIKKVHGDIGDIINNIISKDKYVKQINQTGLKPEN